MKYEVIHETSVFRIQELVNEKLNAGYELYGNLETVSNANYRTIFYQPMIKRDTKEISIGPIPMRESDIFEFLGNKSEVKTSMEV